jgi:hypothetical protein
MKDKAENNARLNDIEVRGGSGPGWNPGDPFPTLGDPSRTWDVALTEPEINAIHSAMGFIRSACKDWPSLIGKYYWNHYGPTLQALSDRLTVYDDPRATATPNPPPTVEPKP